MISILCFSFNHFLYSSIFVGFSCIFNPWNYLSWISVINLVFSFSYQNKSSTKSCFDACMKNYIRHNKPKFLIDLSTSTIVMKSNRTISHAYIKIRQPETRFCSSVDEKTKKLSTFQTDSRLYAMLYNVKSYHLFTRD